MYSAWVTTSVGVPVISSAFSLNVSPAGSAGVSVYVIAGSPMLALAVGRLIACIVVFWVYDWSATSPSKNRTLVWPRFADTLRRGTPRVLVQPSSGLYRSCSFHIQKPFLSGIRFSRWEEVVSQVKLSELPA